MVWFAAYMQWYNLSDRNADNADGDLPERAVSEIRVRARMLFEGRSLVMTANGFLAFVPNIAVKDDLIFVVAGAIAPLGLRPVSGENHEYEYLGESYIHDIMDGEFADRLKDEG
jgi:hypothetical protein